MCDVIPVYGPGQHGRGVSGKVAESLLEIWGEEGTVCATIPVYGPGERDAYNIWMKSSGLLVMYRQLRCMSMEIRLWYARDSA